MATVDRVTLRTKGVAEMIRAADRAGKETGKAVRKALRQAAEPVRATAREKIRGGLNSTSAGRTASGLAISVRRTGIVSVEQRRRKTTGKHPEFGGWQMRHSLIPALQENRSETVRQFDRAVDEIQREFRSG